MKTGRGVDISEDMATNYGITASTSADALRSLVNTAYSEVYSLAATAGSTAATTISNLLTLPETVGNWPLYSYIMVPKVERLLFIDIERTDQLDATRARIIQLLALLSQIARYAAAAPADKSALFISRLVVVSSLAASRLTIPTPLASLQVACQALASQLDSDSLRRVAKSIYDVLVTFAMDVDKDVPPEIGAPFEIATRTAHAVANGLDPPLAAMMFAAVPASSPRRTLELAV